MRAIGRLVALAKAREGRLVDHDALAGRLAAEDAFLAVEEHRIGDGQVAHFGADARAVAVVHAHAAEDDAVDRRTAPAQDEDRLAFARVPLEYRAAGRDRLEGDVAARLDGAFAVGARRDQDRALAHADRSDRVVERREALPGLGDDEGRRAALRRCRERQGEDGEQDEAHRSDSEREGTALPRQMQTAR